MATKSETLEIHALKQGEVTLRIMGVTPLLFNAMSAKAQRDLLIGGSKKTSSEKKEIKHNPEKEFRDSTHKLSTGPTLLGFPASGMKAAMATASMYTDGITKTSVNRLVSIPADKINIWGKPYLHMAVVRMADINKTPDIRTRAILPEWCAEIDIRFITPDLSTHSVVNLLVNAGMVCGIGDHRPGKAGDKGMWSVTSDQEKWERITQQGRDVQSYALDNPEMYDEETAELYNMLVEERMRRAA